MAKPTLLEIVQDLLSDMDGDEVNSIQDTIEAQQIASAVRQTYRYLVEVYDLQHVDAAFQLEASGTSDRPTHMTVPSNVHEVRSIRYNVSSTSVPSFQSIPWADNETFLNTASNLNTADAEYEAVTDPGSGFVLTICNNKAPRMWTSFDGGRTLVFDSYDSSLESTLQAAKTQCLGRERNDMTLTDSSVCDLPETLQSLLYNEARELCFDMFKDGAPRKVNEMARYSKAKARERMNQIEIPPIEEMPNYGRKR